MSARGCAGERGVRGDMFSLVGVERLMKSSVLVGVTEISGEIRRRERVDL